MRFIIHSDMNSFYASVEQAENIHLRNKPVIVGGNEALRHGIVLAASYEAKRFGVKTGMPLVQARACCPDAVMVPPRFAKYKAYSQAARELYYEYSDLVEPFGLDEAWIDITHSVHLFGGSPELVAQEISERVKAELGVSVSVGLSWNKIFAKFGSDYKKPDGYTRITPENMRSVVWLSPVQDLLYVGSATAQKLQAIGIATIGDLACADRALLKNLLGKPGLMIQQFALGNDISEVRPYKKSIDNIEREVKSVGNGITLPFDVKGQDAQSIEQVMWLLGESVSQRLRLLNKEAQGVAVGFRLASDLSHHSVQKTLETPTNITKELCAYATDLACKECLRHKSDIRSFEVRAFNLTEHSKEVQFDIWGKEYEREKQRTIDQTIDLIRRRFGQKSLVRGIELYDERLAHIDPFKEHTIHPVSFFS